VQCYCCQGGPPSLPPQKSVAAKRAAEEKAALAVEREVVAEEVDDSCTLHVRGVGGRFEAEVQLRIAFSKFGQVVQTTIRHREDESGQNTSWALVTMCSESEMLAALNGDAPINPTTKKPVQVCDDVWSRPPGMCSLIPNTNGVACRSIGTRRHRQVPRPAPCRTCCRKWLTRSGDTSNSWKKLWQARETPRTTTKQNS
jgi:hypothetical protein